MMNKILNALNEPKVLAAILTALYVATIALAFAIAAPNPAAGGELAYAPLQAIEAQIGQKQVVAVYVRDGEACQINVMVQETGLPQGASFEAMPTAARFSMSLAPGKAAMVDTAEGQGVSFTCGAGAESLAVNQTGLRVFAAN